MTMSHMRARDRMYIAEPAALPYRYRAYGLTFHSEFALPELRLHARDDNADVTIRRRAIARRFPEPSTATAFDFATSTQYLAWQSVASYLIRDARQIDVDPAPGASEPLMRLPLLGPVFGLLLHLRNMLVLHASAVAIDGRAAIFLGNKQAGKSTTAAALVAAGHRLLADDILVIDFQHAEGPHVVPGFPQIKLSLDAAAAVADDRRTAVQPPPFPGFEKRQHRLVDRFSDELAAPTRLYVLARGAETAITPLAPAEALTSLIRFSYVTRFGKRALKDAAGRHLRQCAKLAGAVPAGRLQVPAGFHRLSEAVGLVESDIAGDQVPKHVRMPKEF